MSKIEGVPGVVRTGLARLCVALLAFLCVPVSAVPRIDGLDIDQMSVRELMQQDTELALTLARQRSSGVRGTGVQPPQRVARPMTGEPRLAAIYGVGRQLMAEVVLDQVIYLYRHGQALPVGVAPADDVYLLKKITPSCIDLKNAGASHHLCLRPAQWVGK